MSSIDEDDDSFFSVEMIADANEDPTEGDFEENNDESMEKFCNDDGKDVDLVPSIINELIDTVAGSMEIKQGTGTYM